jgi:hypothetical protein
MPGQVTGLDINPDMVQLARSLPSQLPISWQEGSALQPLQPFPKDHSNRATAADRAVPPAPLLGQITASAALPRAPQPLVIRSAGYSRRGEAGYLLV